jgi:uncharacterized membrane protein required for colicin V production
MFIVFSVPDTYKAISGKISGSQYFKNMTSLAASFTCSIMATALAGGVIGKKAGGKINKKVGQIIGFCAGLTGGAIGGTAVKTIGNLLHEDDAIITARLFNAVLLNQFFGYMLSSAEQDQVIALLDKDEKQLRNLQQSLYKSDHQEQDVIEYLTPRMNSIIKKRKKIEVSDELQMEDSINSIILKGELVYDM